MGKIVIPHSCNICGINTNRAGDFFNIPAFMAVEIKREWIDIVDKLATEGIVLTCRCGNAQKVFFSAIDLREAALR